MGRIMQDNLFQFLHDFILDFLPEQRCSSEKTVIVYRRALNKYFDYIVAEKGISFDKLTLDVFSYENVSRYIVWMKEVCLYSSATINQRLAGIKSFVAYTAVRQKENLCYVQALSSIQAQKSNKVNSIQYLSEQAIQTIFNQPDVRTIIGIRDLFFLILLYDSGARIDEIMHLRVSDIKLGKHPTVLLFGKGRKIRSVPLMDETISHFQRYIEKFHPNAVQTPMAPLFYVNHNGGKRPMSDDNARRFIQEYADQARLKCSDIPPKVYPHLFRHTRAMHLYQHGMDLTLISQWLGHAQLETTLIYAHADTERKREAIQKAMLNSSMIIPQSDKKIGDEELLRRLCGLTQ